jgi:D-methionine transport system permease protein
MENLINLLPELWKAAGETLYIVGFTLFFGGIGGLLVGLGLYLSRAGSILENKAVFSVLNVLVNTVRPIPFIIFLAAAQPLARLVVGSGIGNNAIIFTIALAASFAMGRIVEQNLLTVTPGVIEAARSVGAGPCGSFSRCCCPRRWAR